MFNYLDRSKHQELVDNIFNSMWLCESTKVCLSLINKVPKTLPIFEQPQPTSGSFRNITGVTRTEVNNNADGIIDMLYGTSRNAVGAEFNNFIGITPVERTYLSTAALAELVYLKGTVTLVNVIDSVKIHNDISRYIETISFSVAAYPHYQPPPKEDLDAFNNLLKLLENMVSDNLQEGLGNTAFAQLLRMADNKATSLNIKPIENSNIITLNGLTNTCRIGPNYVKSPYDFT